MRERHAGISHHGALSHLGDAAQTWNWRTRQEWRTAPAVPASEFRADEPETEWYETVRHEIDDWLSAIHAGRSPQLSGRSALPTVKVIEDCYRNVRPLEEAWVQEGLSSHSGNVSASSNGHQRRVLVTGATGFIGSLGRDPVFG